MSTGDSRVQGIDLLRGFCIVAVIFLHISVSIPLGTHYSAVNTVLFSSGYYGVRVFFVISGFLIATWSLKRWGTLAKINLPHFYTLRFARIIPCLIGLLGLLAMLDRAGISRFTIDTQHTSLAAAFFAALTFHINWLQARIGFLPAGWNVLWSLSVEEVFYVFFPLVCALIRKKLFLASLLSAFIVVGPFARVVFTHNSIWSDYGYLSCMDGIAFGCLAAIVSADMRFGKTSKRALLLSGIFISVLIVAFRGTVARMGLHGSGLDITVLQLGSALLVIAMQQRVENGSPMAPASRISTFKKFLLAGARLPSAAMRWFGRNSYEIYLTHTFAISIVLMLARHFHQSPRQASILCVGATALAGSLGSLIARFYSEPLNLKLRTMLPRLVAGALTFPRPSREEA